MAPRLSRPRPFTPTDHRERPPAGRRRLYPRRPNDRFCLAADERDGRSDGGRQGHGQRWKQPDRNGDVQPVQFGHDARNSSTLLFSDTETLSSGSATSASYTTTAAGTDYWVDTYNGDANNNPVTGGAASDSVSVNKSSPSISSVSQPGSVTVGATVADKATVSGGTIRPER